MSSESNLVPDPADVEKNRVWAILSYILFVIPLLGARESKFAMYHANQGLNLFLAAIILNIVGTIIPIIGWLIIVPLGNLVVLIFAILGIIKAAGGKAEPLPLIGQFNLFKL